jgi:hypothetical protein
MVIEKKYNRTPFYKKTTSIPRTGFLTLRNSLLDLLNGRCSAGAWLIG